MVWDIAKPGKAKSLRPEYPHRIVQGLQADIVLSEVVMPEKARSLQSECRYKPEEGLQWDIEVPGQAWG
jgi:hypothetical protein